MNADAIRKLKEQAAERRRSRIEEDRIAAEREWLTNGITRVEQCIQNAAQDEHGSYQENCETFPDFVIKHFKNLGFEVGVTNNRRGGKDMLIRWAVG
jgi:hypothetical protein